ncbi:glycosyltransferase EpsF [Evansella vedderi]|uniref:Glycosyltransferase EpsF n=1 Tax=Evansella vedderi TaxID=38282 RepID=A0ABU0A2J1_9BACI|nr:glycosyltransferase [Evansella vedderi]MDQ0256570.1 glycosyltransferase EpsF [Evansella vedderi]
MSKKIRVLHVLGGLWCGGTETFVMNMFRSIDREKVEFDFLVHEKSRTFYDDEVESLGGRIFRVPDRIEVGTLKYIINLLRILKHQKPDVIHAHAMFNSGVIMLVAYISRIKKRICHAHSTNDQFGNSISRMLFRLVMRLSLRLFATNYAACSNFAAEYLFGSRLTKKNRIDIINNGVDLHKYFSITQQETNDVRKELMISEDNYVIGIVSRLVEVKNPLFIIKLFKKIHQNDNKTIVVIVGDGPLKVNIEKELEHNGLKKFVRITGNRKDIPQLLSLFDVFVMPSQFEGVPIAAIEAQAKGLPCILSKGVPNTADMGLGLTRHIALNDEKGWVDAINSKPPKIRDIKNIKKAFKTKGFDNGSASYRLLQIYGGS